MFPKIYLFYLYVKKTFHIEFGNLFLKNVYRRIPFIDFVENIFKDIYEIKYALFIYKILKYKLSFLVP